MQSTTCWFTPQIPVTVWSGPGQNQEPRAPSRSSMWATGTQVQEPPSAASQGELPQGAGWSQMQESILSILIGNVDIPRGGLTLYLNACP